MGILLYLIPLTAFAQISVEIESVYTDSVTAGELNAEFPYPILTFITVKDANGQFISGLADSLQWLGPNDVIPGRTETISDIWFPVALDPNNSNTTQDSLFEQNPAAIFKEFNRATDPVISTSTSIVLDNSGSMYNNSIVHAKNGAKSFINAMRPDDRIGFIAFSDSTELKVIDVIDDRDSLLACIDNLQKGDDTHLYHAFWHAIESVKRENSARRTILLLTDGMGEDSGDTPYYNPDSVIAEALRSNITVHAIALKPERPNNAPPDTAALRRITRETGGVYQYTEDAAELVDIYTGYAGVVQMTNFYVMAHISPEPCSVDGTRQVTVQLNVDGFSGEASGFYDFQGDERTYDLVVEKNSSKDTVYVGETFRYSIDIANNGQYPAYNVEVIDTIPDYLAVTGFSIPPTDTIAVNVFRWRIDDLGANSIETISYDVQINAAVPDSVTQFSSSSVALAECDSDLSNNTGGADVVIGAPLLAVVQTVTTDSTDASGINYVAEGDTYSYTIRVANIGSVPAVDVSIRDILPDFTAYVAGDTLITLDSLNVDSSNVFTVDLAVADSLPSDNFPLINSVVASAANAPETASADTVIGYFNRGGPPGGGIDSTQLSVLQQVMTDSMDADGNYYVAEGDTYSYTIRVDNIGPATALDVSIRDILPEFTSYVAGDTLIALDSLNVDSSSVFTLDLVAADSLPSDTYPLINTVVAVASNAPQAASADTVTGIPGGGGGPPGGGIDSTQLSVLQQVTTDSMDADGNYYVAEGDTYSYTIRVDNIGPATALGISIRDILPEFTSYVAGDTLIALDSLTVDSSSVFTLDLVAADSLPSDTYPLINTVVAVASNAPQVASADTVTGIPGGGGPPGGGIDSTQLSVLQQVTTDSMDVDGNYYVAEGDTYSYTIRVDNIGPATALEVSIRDILPEFTSYVAGDTLIALDSLNVDSSSVFTLDLVAADSLPSDTYPLINMVVAVASNAPQAASADTVTGIPGGGGGPPGGGIDSTQLSVLQQVTTDSMDADGNYYVAEGDTYSYTIRVDNIGPATALDVSIRDILPEFTNYVAGDTLITLDSLNVDSSSVFTLDLVAADSLPSDTYPLINTVVALASNAPQVASADTVTGIPGGGGGPPGGGIDSTQLSVLQQVTTDSMDADGNYYVAEGDTYSYTIRVDNVGPATALDVAIRDILPEFTSYVAGDTLIALDSLNVDSSSVFTLDLVAADSLPSDTYPLINTVVAVASNAPQVASADTVTGIPGGGGGPPGGGIDSTQLSVLQQVTTDSMDADGNYYVAEGDTYSYTIRVDNIGPATALDVSIRDILPEFTSYVAGDTLISLDSLNVDSSSVFTLDLVAADSLPSDTYPLINTVVAVASNAPQVASADTVTGIPGGGGGPPGGGIDSTQLSVLQQVMTDSMGADGNYYVAEGDTYSYTIRVDNVGPATALDVSIRDILPEFTSYVAGDTLITLDSLNVDSSSVFTLDLVAADSLPSDTYPLINTVVAVASNAPQVASADTVTGIPGDSGPPGGGIDSTQLTVLQQVTTDSMDADGNYYVAEGDTYSYTIRVDNVGPATALDVSIRDILPEFTSYVAGDTLISLDSLNVDSSSVFTLDLVAADSLPSDTYPLINTVVAVASNAPQAASADTVTGIPGGPGPDGGKDSTQIVVYQQVSVDSTDSAGNHYVAESGSYSYTIQVKNTGNAAATDLIIRDILPDFANYASGDTLVEIASLAAGDSSSFSLGLAAADSLPSNNYPLVNRVQASAANAPDAASADTVFGYKRTVIDSTIDGLRVVQMATTDSFNVENGDTTRFALENERYTIVITVFNDDPDFPARDVVVTDILPDSVRYDGFKGGDSIIWELGDIPNNDKRSITLTPTVSNDIPFDEFPLINEVIAHAGNERPGSPVGASKDTVFALKNTPPIADGEEDFWIDVNVFEPRQGLPLGITVQFPLAKRAALDLLDIAGYRITRLYEGTFNSGLTRREWDGNVTETGQPVGSGVYIITLLSEDRSIKAWKKVIIRR